MHREVLSAPVGSQVDHKDTDGLNNTKANLRLATASDNACNVRLSTRNRSGRKGVSWSAQKGRWQVHICRHGVRRNLGLFCDLEEAARAYEEASKRLHGEFGRA